MSIKQVPKKSMIVSDAIQYACRQGLSYNDASRLLMHVLQYSNFTSVLMHSNESLTSDQKKKYDQCIQRLLKHEPLDYIMGISSFWSMDFMVNSNVLIPRPETEILVQMALYYGHLLQDQLCRPLRVVDLGTGSGIIAIVIAKHTDWHMTAVDCSASAIQIAKHNANLHGIHSIHWVLSNWGEQVHDFFDLIITNPPYIEPNDPVDSSLCFEPAGALFQTKPGEPMATIFQWSACHRMGPHALLLVEHGYRQYHTLETQGLIWNWHVIDAKKDEAGHPRVMVFQT